ncbi:MotE family protein [Poseidonocella sp. HB161398]|uniref:MotE family protein n=1 Tax=Poseidonocella sp. HB161398 TaxID=2320855 RepID=UPI001108C89E|nr:hypothetical protein [Poseidonocella sp. HB161398]
MYKFSFNKLPKANEALYILSIGALALSILVKYGIALENDSQIDSDIAVLEEVGQGREASEIDALIEKNKLQLKSLQDRQDRLDEREKVLLEREREIESKLTELKNAEETLLASISIAKDAASSDVQRILSVYSEMKTEDLSPIFEMMDPNLAAGFISKMPPPKAAQVLGGLTSEKSYSIIAIISGRNAQ